MELLSLGTVHAQTFATGLPKQIGPSLGMPGRLQTLIIFEVRLCCVIGPTYWDRFDECLVLATFCIH